MTTATAKRVANALKSPVSIHHEDPLVLLCDSKGWLIWCVIRDHKKPAKQTHCRVDAMYLQDFDKYCFEMKKHPVVAILFRDVVKVQFVHRGFPYSVARDGDQRWFLLPV
jgi:hypothetical protein